MKSFSYTVKDELGIHARPAWGIPELRKKIIFTALILLIFRIGNARKRG